MSRRASTASSRVGRLDPVPVRRSRLDRSWKRGVDVNSGEVGRTADRDAIGPRFLPVVQTQSVRFEEIPDLRRTPADDLLEDGHQNAERVIAQHRRPGDSGEPVDVETLVTVKFVLE